MYLAPRMFGLLFLAMVFHGNDTVFAIGSAVKVFSPGETGNHSAKSAFTPPDDGFLYRGGIDFSIEAFLQEENSVPTMNDYSQTERETTENLPVRSLEGEINSSFNVRMWKNAETWIEVRIPRKDMFLIGSDTIPAQAIPLIDEGSSTEGSTGLHGEMTQASTTSSESDVGQAIQSLAEPVSESPLLWSELPSVMMRSSNAWIAWGPGQAASVLKTSGGRNSSRSFEKVVTPGSLHSGTPEVGGAAGLILPSKHMVNGLGLGAFRRDNPDSIATRARLSWAIRRDGVTGTLYGGLSYDLVSLERLSVSSLWKPGRALVLPARFSNLEGRTAFENDQFTLDFRTYIIAGTLVTPGWSSVFKFNFLGDAATTVLEVLGTTPEFRELDAGFSGERFRVSFSRLPVGQDGGVSIMTWLALKYPGSLALIEERKYPSPVFWYECLESELKLSFLTHIGKSPLPEENSDSIKTMQDFQNPDLQVKNAAEESEAGAKNFQPESTRVKDHPGRGIRIEPGLSMNVKTNASGTEISEPEQDSVPEGEKNFIPMQEDFRTKALFPLAVPVLLPAVHFQSRIYFSAETMREKVIGNWKCSYGWRFRSSFKVDTVWEQETGFCAPVSLLNSVPGLAEWNSDARLSIKLLRSRPGLHFIDLQSCTGTVTATISSGTIPVACVGKAVSRFQFFRSGRSKSFLEVAFQVLAQGERQKPASTNSDYVLNQNSFIRNLFSGFNILIKGKYQCSLSLYIPVEGPSLQESK